MENLSEAKSSRLLVVYSRLVNGEVVSKADLSEQYHVSERSIQRDMESLRCFIANQSLAQDIIYDYKQRGYRLVNTLPKGLSNSEILAVCKILLESRSMCRDEMLPILDKLIDCAVPEESRRAVVELIANEKHHYIEPHHGKSVLNGLWEIGQAIKQHQYMEIEYERMKGPKYVRRRIQPVGLMFSEYYFYLTAFLEDKADFENPDDLFPTIGLTVSGLSKWWRNIFTCPTPSVLRKASSASGYSLCTEGSWSASNSVIQGRPWKRCWTGCLQRRSSAQTMRAGQSERKCSARALICG